MAELKIRYLVAAAIGAAIAGIVIASRLPAPAMYRSIVGSIARIAAQTPAPMPAAQQVEINLPYGGTNSSQLNVLDLPRDARSNVLELPSASADFVGVWGAYTHSTVYSVTPGTLVAKGPDRISVTFGRQGDSVFIASELYTGPHQRIAGKPRASMSSPAQAVVTYTASDDQLDYVYLHRFKLLRSGNLAYSQKVDIYDRRNGKLVGRATQHAVLKRLTTPQEWVNFSRPAPFEVSRGEVSAARNLTVRK
jgi:hypothetical protein